MTSRSFYSIIDHMKDKDLNEIHRHHIVPKYKCKELGIDPNFDDNLVDITRLKHAEIHWGYKCNDLSPLLEVCNPPQYVLDMIPLGDNRDVGAAQFLALGEIDGIDSSGENNNMWGRKHTPEAIEKFRQRALDPAKNHMLWETNENGDRVRRSWKGKKNPMYGYTFSDEQRLQMSESHKKRMNHPDYVNPNLGRPSPLKGTKTKPHSEETKRKQSESAKKRYANPDYVNPLLGKSMSNEAKENMAKAQQKRFAKKDENGKSINNPSYGKTLKFKGGVNPLKGVPRSAETIQKMKDTKARKKLEKATATLDKFL